MDCFCPLSPPKHRGKFGPEPKPYLLRARILRERTNALSQENRTISDGTGHRSVDGPSRRPRSSRDYVAKCMRCAEDRYRLGHEFPDHPCIIMYIYIVMLYNMHVLGLLHYLATVSKQEHHHFCTRPATKPSPSTVTGLSIIVTDPGYQYTVLVYIHHEDRLAQVIMSM